MKRRGLRLTALLLILLGAGFYYLSQNLPSLLEGRIRAELSQYGVTEFALGEPYWGLTGAGTRQLAARGEIQGWDFQLSIEDLQADYHWRALLNGEVKQVSAGRVRLTLHSLSPRSEDITVIEIAEYVDFLRSLALPLELVSVDLVEADILINDQYFRLTGKEFELNGIRNEIEATLVVETTLPDIGELRLDLDLTPSKVSPWIPSVELSLDQGTERILAGALELVSTAPIKLHFRGDLEFREKIPLIAALLAEAGIPFETFETQIRFDLSTGLPDRLDPDDPVWWHAIPLTAAVSVAANTGPIADLGLTGFVAAFETNVEKDGDRFTARVPSPVTGRLGVVADHWQIPPEFLAGEVEAPFEFSLALLEPLQFAVTAEGIPELAPVGASIQLVGEKGFALDAQLSDATWRGGLSGQFAGTADLIYSRQTLPQLAFDIALRPDSGGQKIAGSVKAQEVNLALTGSATLSERKTAFSAEIKLDDLTSILGLADRFEYLPAGLKLASGSVTLKLSGSLAGAGKSPSLFVGFRAQQLSGLFNGIAFSGARFSGKLAKNDFWRSLEPLVVEIPEASAGVELKDINAEIFLVRSTDFASSRWNIKGARASVFSGEVALAETAQVDYPFTGNRIAVSLSNLDLEQILALYAKQGVSGNGKLSGTVPLVLSAGGVRVDRGQIYNLEAGTIRFRHSGATAITNEQVAMTMRLLENFEYEALNVTAQLAEDGQLVLETRLAGRNPAEFDGRQVNFNINVEDNIFDLYKVLTLSDKLTRQLENRIRDK